MKRTLLFAFSIACSGILSAAPEPADVKPVEQGLSSLSPENLLDVVFVSKKQESLAGGGRL